MQPRAFRRFLVLGSLTPGLWCSAARGGGNSKIALKTKPPEIDCTAVAEGRGRVTLTVIVPDNDLCGY
ncbi:hypothetical protein L596_012291 [Steinernema carpocapsae]|uniref:ZP domain-containing protein n=1 Tax=Steinernema carpocapsae TaxID=34508 RepID=A0A4U5NWK9_STECR|nr:hypothetical protein L596_012291 [Steinernema carpocapsae]